MLLDIATLSLGIGICDTTLAQNDVSQIEELKSPSKLT